MTKKRSRNARRSAARRTTMSSTPRPAPQPAAHGPASPRSVVQQTAAANVDFASEYHYVLRDLRRLGQLAAAMFATLIVLALIVR
jgi:hypothetical protein